ncbi:NrdH-redoxin [bacterium]|nr:MAG: NrdH-redoxin [bacterium]
MRVIVFTAPGCPWCTRAKNYLRERGISFKEVDISRNPSAARDLVRMTGQTGVPVIVINGKPVVGFNKPLIDRLLGLK